MIKKSVVLVILILSLVFSGLYAGEKQVVDKTFKPAKSVTLKVVSGDAVIKKGGSGEIKVHVVYTYPTDKFKPVFEEKGDTLILKEEFAKNTKNIKGESSWTVTVPAGTDISFGAASGDLDVSGLNGKLHVKVASGDIKLNDHDGDVSVKAASGDMTFTNVKGVIDINCASGDITATGVTLTGASSFKAVSGDLTVTMAKSSGYDFTMSTVSGDMTLDYNGNSVKGYFSFKGMKGDIQSDVPFDSKDESKYNPFTKKHFSKGDSPKVSLKTVSGSITFKK